MRNNWNSRKRVEAALNHQESDRVPLSMTITEIPYLGLREHLGLPADPNLNPNRFGEVAPGIDLLEALGFDTVSLKLSSPLRDISPPNTPDGTIFDEWGVGRKRIDLDGEGFLLEVCYSPLEDLHPDEIDLDEYPWPDPYDPGRTADLEDRAQNLFDDTDLALVGRFGGTIMEQAAFIRGYENWMIDLVTYPEFARALMNRIADIQIVLDRVGIQKAGRYLSIFKASGDDLGMQDRPLFSDQVWQEILRPILSRRWKAARMALNQADASHVKLMFHSDGAIRNFIPDLIQDGIDVLDPIQKHCPGMDFNQLKADFGSQLVFHGGVDTQQLLPFGTVAEVQRETRRTLKALGPDGGLIIGPAHNVQPDVPPENLVAMCQTVLDHGFYPL